MAGEAVGPKVTYCLAVELKTKAGSFHTAALTFQPRISQGEREWTGTEEVGGQAQRREEREGEQREEREGATLAGSGLWPWSWLVQEERDNGSEHCGG